MQLKLLCFYKTGGFFISNGEHFIFHSLAGPLTGPPVTHTSYYSGDCVNQKRDIIIYWQVSA